MADVFWIGANSESWTDGQNWSGGAAPSAGDVIYFGRNTKFSPLKNLDKSSTNFSQILGSPDFQGTVGRKGEPLICACDWIAWNSPGSIYVNGVGAVGAGELDRIHVSAGTCQFEVSSPADVVLSGGETTIKITTGGTLVDFTQLGEGTRSTIVGLVISGVGGVITNFELKGGDCVADRITLTNCMVTGGVLHGAQGFLAAAGTHRLIGGTFDCSDRFGEVNNTISVYPGAKLDCTKFTGHGKSSRGRLYFNTINVYGGIVDLRNGTEQVTINTGININASDYQILVDGGQKWTVADQ